jgi:hypothetical protein
MILSFQLQARVPWMHPPRVVQCTTSMSVHGSPMITVCWNRKLIYIFLDFQGHIQGWIIFWRYLGIFLDNSWAAYIFPGREGIMTMKHYKLLFLFFSFYLTIPVCCKWQVLLQPLYVLEMKKRTTVRLSWLLSSRVKPLDNKHHLHVITKLAKCVCVCESWVGFFSYQTLDSNLGSPSVGKSYWFCFFVIFLYYWMHCNWCTDKISLKYTPAQIWRRKEVMKGQPEE